MYGMAAEGAHLENAFVSTSLSSPSRALILTGNYPFWHSVVVNNNIMLAGILIIGETLQKASHLTGCFGKWFIGDDQNTLLPGFDYWVNFRGQGVYYNPTLITKKGCKV